MKYRPGKRVIGWFALASFIIAILYVIWLDYRVIDRFTGRLWSLPARVYARPLELYAGKKMTVEELLFELNSLDYQRVDQPPTRPGRFHQWDNHFEIKTRAFRFWDGSEESREIRIDIHGDTVSALHGLYNKKAIPLIRLDPVYITGIFPAHGEDRILVRLEDAPDVFLQMLVMVEDRRFYEHNGVDLKSIGRALLANIKAGKTVQGGSTITQQLVKNMFLTPDRNLWRKVNEAVMSLLLELHYDKEQILETYLNEVYLGQDNERAIHGFGLASDFYFGKPLSELDLDQMAVLIGMVKGASYYNPVRNPERATRRRNTVIDVVESNGLISESQALIQKNRPLVVTSRNKRSLYPAFINLVQRQLIRDYDAEDLKSEGLRIFTTLDPYVQKITEKSIRTTVPELDRQSDELQAAAVVASADSGEILAIVGDRNPSFAGFNRALDAQRHIGSLMKPVIYLTAVKQKENYTLGSLLSDTRLRVQGEDKKVWEPENYDKEFHGDVIMYEALLKSYNIPAARLGLELGLSNISDTLRQLGSNKVLPPYPSITLGAVDMSPFEMASIYQTFAASGFHSPLRSVRAVLDKHGTPLKRYQLDVKRETDPAAIALINFVLNRVTHAGTAKGLSKSLGFEVAGKTGTSDELHDSWFAGFSRDKVAVVWVGFDDHRPTGLTGSSGAMRVWRRIFADISVSSVNLDLPDDIHLVWIDQPTGLRSAKHCENAVELPYIRGTEPEEYAGCEARSPLDWLKKIFK
ncbi:MAG: penicillin-binding protein 1B [Thiotrichales bacterium]|nr:MAG: penicillin-binding protein 1B [Thiotrichales bacterium]